jgi:3-oxoacyl-[acyl-carrier protein] reductase
MRVLVSGGSRGLGAELCERLLADGHKVATFARSSTEFVEQMQQKFADAFVFSAMDATDTDRVNSFVRTLDGNWDGIDALVNNAAIGQDSLFVHTSPDEIAAIIDVNLRAPMVLSRAVVRTMLRRNIKGHILTVGSIGATEGYAGLSVYSATKGAAESFTRSLARELKGRVFVNVIAPGFFESEMSSVLLPEQLQSIMSRTPSGHLSTPQQVVDVVNFMLTSNTNLNGTVIAVDGGASA